MAVCTSVELLEALDDTTSILKVTIDDNISALMLMDYAEALKFVNQEVVYSLRKDIYKQEVTNFIATLTRPVAVNTFERNGVVKLFCDVADPYSNVSFADVAEGEFVSNAIVYCADQTYESSEKAYWCKYTVLDRNRHTAFMRLFDPDTRTAKFKGTYIKCDLRRSVYGFTATLVQPMVGFFPINPEVDIAERTIKSVFAEDSEISAIIENSKLLEFMRKHVDYEPGYITVRTAMELAMATEMENLVNHLDLQIVKQALLLSKLFILSADSKYSKPVVNIIKASHYKFKKRIDTLLLLDEAGECVTGEKVVYHEIIRLVDAAIRTKKEAWRYSR